MVRAAARVDVAVAVLGPVRAELYRYGAGRVERIVEHAHREFQFGYSPTGRGGFRIGRRWYDNEPNQVHCVPPACEHATGRDGVLERPADYLMVYVEPEHVSRLVARADDGGGGTRPPPYASSADPAVARAMGRLVADAVRGLNPVAADDRVLALLDALVPAPADVGDRPKLASTARDYLMANLGRHVDLVELGGACGTHAGTVRRAFKAAFGVPPHRFVLMERLNRARARLAGGRTIAEAAHGLGFVDQSHLTRLMRRYFGHTPGAVAGPPAHFVQDGR